MQLLTSIQDIKHSKSACAKVWIKMSVILFQSSYEYWWCHLVLLQNTKIVASRDNATSILPTFCQHIGKRSTPSTVKRFTATVITRISATRCEMFIVGTNDVSLGSLIRNSRRMQRAYKWPNLLVTCDKLWVRCVCSTDISNDARLKVKHQTLAESRVRDVPHSVTSRLSRKASVVWKCSCAWNGVVGKDATEVC